MMKYTAWFRRCVPAVRCGLAALLTVMLLPLSAQAAVSVACEPTISLKQVRLAESLGRPPGSGGGLAALSAPSFLDAMPVVPGLVTGLLTADETSDVYAIMLAAGERVSLNVRAPADTNFDLYLYRTPDQFGRVGSSLLDAYPETLTHDVRAPFAGTYYIVVERFSGVGTYALDISVTSAPLLTAIHAIPGVPLVLPVVTGRLDRGTEPDHVYAVNLAPGQRLTLTLDFSGGDADVFVFGPAATDVERDIPLASAATRSVPELLVWDVPATAGGTYYINVWSASGSPTYTLTANIQPTPALPLYAEIPGLPAPASPFVDVISAAGGSRVYALPSARAGDRITLSLAGQLGTDFDVRLFAPTATSVRTAVPVAQSTLPLYPERITYTVPSAAAGVYYVEVTSHHGGGPFVLTWTVGPRGAAVLQRLAGDDRFLTSVAISQNTFAQGSCETVVLATGAAFADALSASALAGAYRSPILLTAPARLPSAVLAEIRRLGATNVLVVGGPAAVGEHVTAALTAAGLQWRRVAGGDRFETAIAVAREARAETLRAGRSWGDIAFVVRSDDFADALAVAPLAYARTMPVLLTRPGKLHPSTAAGLVELGIADVVVAGGTAAVSATTMASIRGVPGVLRTDRLHGVTRYETAAAVADYAVRFRWGGVSVVGLATGVNFADALSGGAAAGARGGMLLLTTTNRLPEPSARFFREHAGTIPAVHVYGGVVAVQPSVMDAIVAIRP